MKIRILRQYWMLLLIILLFLSNCTFDNDHSLNESIINDGIMDEKNMNNEIIGNDSNELLSPNCSFPRIIQSDEKQFLDEVKSFNNIVEIVDFFNDEFVVIESDNFSLTKPVNVYYARQGSESELLRLFLVIALRNCYDGQIIVYEYSEFDKIDYDAVVIFRGFDPLEEVDKPKYFYYDGEFKVEHYGWSYSEFILKEEERNNINIIKMGYLSDFDSWHNKESYLLDVYEWILREQYVI